MTREEYIRAFRAGTLNRPAMLPPSTTMADLHKLLRELGRPRVRHAYGADLPFFHGGYELIVLMGPITELVDRYYRRRDFGDANLLLITEYSDARMVVAL